MPFSNSETKLRKVKAGHQIEEKWNHAGELAPAVPLPILWQSASFMAVQNL
jgi:hypothetical protein